MGARRLWGIALALLCGEACGQVRLLVQSSPLAGVRYHVIRGTLDASGAAGPSSTNKANRNRKRSKYGVKRPKA